MLRFDFYHLSFSRQVFRRLEYDRERTKWKLFDDRDTLTTSVVDDHCNLTNVETTKKKKKR